MSKIRRALVTGITGQDGAYLAKLLLDQGYEVIGTARRSANYSLDRLDRMGIRDRVRIESLELLELTNIINTLKSVKPDEVYNLAAQSFVATSFSQPLFTGDVDGLGVTRLLEAIRLVNPEIRFYQASTSEMFGKVAEVPQRESTPFYPRSPYGVAKLYGHWITVNYRESYDMFATSGILFNHESPLRGREFVTRKITATLARIRHGQESCLYLGNLNSRRDWGHALDYVRGMYLMMQSEKAQDYVLATGETRTVRDFVSSASEVAGFKIEWSGADENEVGIDRNTGETIVRVNNDYYRPAEVDLLIGTAEKAEKELGWKREYSFEKLVSEMVAADLDLAAKSRL
jgi:GDPmannose 4,6-dehydratase